MKILDWWKERRLRKLKCKLEYHKKTRNLYIKLEDSLVKTRYHSEISYHGKMVFKLESKIEYLTEKEE